ncbi:MAG: hypothetical protein OEY49_15810 [Candidatus Heimdallarchaeota archaeon]|nr:hypothetical protein [Candidatus Heimdallarchaeota archaeon]
MEYIRIFTWVTCPKFDFDAYRSKYGFEVDDYNNYSEINNLQNDFNLKYNIPYKGITPVVTNRIRLNKTDMNVIKSAEISKITNQYFYFDYGVLFWVVTSIFKTNINSKDNANKSQISIDGYSLLNNAKHKRSSHCKEYTGKTHSLCNSCSTNKVYELPGIWIHDDMDTFEKHRESVLLDRDEQLRKYYFYLNNSLWEIKEKQHYLYFPNTTKKQKKPIIYAVILAIMLVENVKSHIVTILSEKSNQLKFNFNRKYQIKYDLHDLAKLEQINKVKSINQIKNTLKINLGNEQRIKELRKLNKGILESELAQLNKKIDSLEKTIPKLFFQKYFWLNTNFITIKQGIRLGIRTLELNSISNYYNKILHGKYWEISADIMNIIKSWTMSLHFQILKTMKILPNNTMFPWLKVINPLSAESEDYATKYLNLKEDETHIIDIFCEEYIKFRYDNMIFHVDALNRFARLSASKVTRLKRRYRGMRQEKVEILLNSLVRKGFLVKQEQSQNNNDEGINRNKSNLVEGGLSIPKSNVKAYYHLNPALPIVQYYENIHNLFDE